MTQYATWASYGGDARTWLALGLPACKLHSPSKHPAAAAVQFYTARARRPGRHDGGLGHLDSGAPGLRNHLLPAGHPRHPGVQARPRPELTISRSLTAAAVLFVIILSRRSPDLPARLASAAIGAIAAPMIFELPFEPIVGITWSRPTRPRGPWSTCPAPSRDHHASAAAALADGTADPGHILLLRADAGRVGSVGLAGFGYPSAPLPIALNIASKICLFAAALTVPAPPARARAGTPARKQRAGRPMKPSAGAHTRRLPADMTPPPDSSGQINSFGMPPLVDAGMVDTDHIGYFSRARGLGEYRA